MWTENLLLFPVSVENFRNKNKQFLTSQCFQHILYKKSSDRNPLFNISYCEKINNVY